MTTPNLSIIMPRAYTLRINDAGSGTMHLTSGGTGVYIPIPVGVCIVQLSWAGATWCRATFRPDGQASSNQEVGFISVASRGNLRTRSFYLASDNPNATMFLQTSSDLGGDSAFRAGVIVMPTPST